MGTENTLFIDDSFEPLKPILDSGAKIKGLNFIDATYFNDGLQDLNKGTVNINLDSTCPAILYKEEQVCCQLAFKLISISLQRDSELLNSLIKASIRWHYNFLQIIVSSYRDFVIPGLIMVKQGSKNEIEFYLVLSISGASEEHVKTLSSDFIAAVNPYILSHHESHPHPYVIEPVTDFETLNKILYPDFGRPSIRLFCEPTCWGNAADYNLDMGDKLQPLMAEFLPKIYTGELYSNYKLLAQSLLSATGTSYLFIHMQPLRLDAREKEFLIKIVNEDILPPHDIPDETVQDYHSRFKNIITTPEDYYLFEVRFLSDTHHNIPKPLDIEIKRHFFPERSIVKSTFQIGLFDNPFSIDKSRKLARLSFIRGISEAFWLFRFPEPLSKPVKGFFYQNASMQFIPLSLTESGLVMGEKVIGGMAKPIRIDTESLKKHMYVLGQTGTGKTTLLKSMINDAISTNQGFCVIDPHGDLIEDIKKLIPPSRKKDVVWFDTNNLEGSAKLNLLMPDVSVKQSMLIDEIIRILAFEYDYKNVGGPMFETYFKSALNLVLHPEVVRKYSVPTLQLAYKALLFPDFLKHLISLTENSSNQESKSDDFSTESIVGSELGRIFNNAFQARGETDWDNMSPYIYSKLKFFTDNVYIRELFDSKEPTLNFRDIMDTGKILLVRMDKGHIGSANLSRVGMLFLNNLIFSIMTRTELPAEKRKDFFIFIDEFQNFLRGDIGIALSEVRKYNVGLVLANQTIGQLDDYLLQSVLGNVGSTAFFRTGINDIGKIRHFIEPEFTAREVINLQNFNCVARIMHNNRPSEPFIFQTIKHWL